MNKIIISLFILLILTGVFFTVDWGCGAKEYVNGGKVVGKEFHPPYTTTQTDSKGKVSTTHHSAEYYLFIEWNGKVHKCSDSILHYHKVKKGDILDNLSFSFGKWTGINYGMSLNN